MCFFLNNDGNVCGYDDDGEDNEMIMMITRGRKMQMISVVYSFICLYISLSIKLVNYLMMMMILLMRIMKS